MNIWIVDGMVGDIWSIFHLRFKIYSLAQRIVINDLKQELITKIAIPSQRNWRSTMSSPHPDLPGVCGTIDGLKICINEAPKDITQSCL